MIIQPGQSPPHEVVGMDDTMNSPLSGVGQGRITAIVSDEHRNGMSREKRLMQRMLVG
ncbi:MAG: hypothetical protein WD424_02985 [Paenibacillaceae bacterium]